MAVKAITWTETGVTLYARGRRPSDDKIWNANVAAPAWEVEDTANVADYTLQHDTFAAETPVGGYRYQVTIPAAWAAGDYELEWYRRVGAAAAMADIYLLTTAFEWDGAAAIVNATNSRLYQQAAREANGVSGTVWHVKYAAGEDLTQDGLSWATAKETAGAGLKTVIEAAAAGDLVLVGAGTFAIAVGIVEPAGVSIRGAGMDATVVTSATADIWMLEIGDKGKISDLTLWATLTDGRYQYPLSSTAVPRTGIVVSRVKLIGDADGFCGGDVEAIFDSCIFETCYDAVNVQETGTVILRDCLINVIGPTTTGLATSRGVVNADSAMSVILERCVVSVCSGGGITYALYSPNLGGTISAFDCVLSAFDTVGTVKTAYRHVGGGQIILVGCQYDRAKLYGAVTDVSRIVTDLAGNAHADAKLVKTVDADTAISARVDASTLAGKFAGITVLTNWLRGLFRKDAMNSTAKGEVNAVHDGGAAGTFNETTDSIEALRDTAPMGSAMRGTDGAYTGTPPTKEENATAAAAAILATPANKVKTNAAGQVESSNVTVAPVTFAGTAATYTFAGAANLAFDVPQAAESSIVGQVLDAAGDAVDLTTADLVFRAVDSSGEEVFRLTEGSGVQTTHADEGQVTITISAEDAADAGTYKYEFWDEAGERLLAKGSFVVRATFGPGTE
jgi:hypothetical protein